MYVLPIFPSNGESGIGNVVRFGHSDAVADSSVICKTVPANMIETTANNMNMFFIFLPPLQIGKIIDAACYNNVRLEETLHERGLCDQQFLLGSING
jgi:hypothetical protein